MFIGKSALLNRMKIRCLLIPLLAASLSACQQNRLAADLENEALDSVALAAIQVDSYKAYVNQLASDEFQGRKPFTKGDTLTVQYIEQQFKALGLEPGNGDSYFQEVPMVEIASSPIVETLTFTGKHGSLNANYLSDYVMGSRRLQENIRVDQSELVFVGFGIVAPEYQWNDYADVDVKGKTVVVMLSDPGHYDKSLFKGDTMTYYGRWTYKYEEAAKQGAAGVLLIHDTGAASYGWDVVRSGWSAPQLALVSPDNGASLAAFEGWISAETTKKLFQLAGLNPSLMDQAKKPSFKAVPLEVQTTVGLHNKFRKSTSSNVIAKLPGSKRADETIIYTAHWDHLGIGEAVNGDSIFNGAIDNAAGVAALFEIAKAFKSAQVKPERSIVFMAVTAEEQGLLGSAYYTKNPIFPLNKTVANLNMDAFSALGASKELSVVGIGQTELEDYVEKSAARFGRTMQGEGNPAGGGFYRSDHFNFVQVGVPGLFMGSGTTLIETDTVALNKRKIALKGRYHTVSDQVDEHWDFEGILADIRVFFDIGYRLSMEKTFPMFKAQSEFKDLGEKRLAK